jgi:preprotein translocase subunit SecE
MASKVGLMDGGEGSSKKRQGMKVFDNAVGTWNEFTRFLSDVRAETRKVVTPSRKEVQATTTVVIVAVFVFGFYFFVVDNLFKFGIDRLLHKLGGIQ